MRIEFRAAAVALAGSEGAIGGTQLVSALIGTVIGGGLVLVATFAAARLERGHEHDQWTRNSRARAYTAVSAATQELRLVLIEISATGDDISPELGQRWNEVMRSVFLSVEDVQLLGGPDVAEAARVLQHTMVAASRRGVGGDEAEILEKLHRDGDPLAHLSGDYVNHLDCAAARQELGIKRH